MTMNEFGCIAPLEKRWRTTRSKGNGYRYAIEISAALRMLISIALQTSQITPLQGFDKLRDAGFSEAEIATMREEFRANAGHSPVDGGA